MAQTRIRVNTAAYRRTHGTYPWNTQGQGRSLWAFTLDDDEKVTLKYGTYHEALTHAKAQAQHSITVHP